MKKILKLLLIAILILSMASCSVGNSDEDEALNIVKKYVTALEEHDTENQQECMDPDLTKLSEGLVNSVGGFLGISDAYNMANGASGILGSAMEQAFDMDLKYNYKKLLESDLSDNDGTITVQYEIVVENKESNEKVKQDVSWKFYMVKKSSDWYIQRYDDVQVILSNEEQESIESYNSVGSTVQEIWCGSNFSEDVVWVACKENDIFKYRVIDKTGKILFELEPDYQPYSLTSEEDWAYKNGTSMVVYKRNTDDEEMCIVDKSGKIIKRLVDDGINLEIKSVNDDYIIVSGYYESIEGDISKEGIIDSLGNELIPMSANVRISYCGSNVFYMDADNYKNCGYYNAETEEYLGSYFEYGKEIIGTNGGLVFSEGYALCVIDEEDENYDRYDYLLKISAKDGSVEKVCKIFDGQSNYEVGKLSDGLVYIEDKEYNASNKGFYDMQGNLVIDLSQYKNIFSYSYDIQFVDGYCAININDFCYFINKNGETILEPFKINDVKISDGVLIARTEDNETRYFDMNGNKLFNSKESGMSPETFSCGLGIVSTTSGVHYVDKSGNIVF